MRTLSYIAFDILNHALMRITLNLGEMMSYFYQYWGSENDYLA